MKIHIIGICGKLNAGLAIELKNIGHAVTGSDKAFYPPMSTLLEKNNLPIMVGYKEEHIDENNLPDLVAYGAAIGEDNPEVIKAMKLNITTSSPTQLLEKFVIKKNSIVITGNYGKTTITGLLVKIFTDLNLNPSYMIGGEIPGLESVKITDSDWSIIEGDEYPADKGGKSKFFYYHPKFLVITSVRWDHTDIFKTEQEYFENFVELVKTLPQDGVLILNDKDQSCYDKLYFELNKRNLLKNLKVAFYNQTALFTNEKSCLKLTAFKDKFVNPQIFGEHNYENVTAAFKVLSSVFDLNFIEENIDKIVNSINTFPGPTRRLQIKYQVIPSLGKVARSDERGNRAELIVIDDFAHNPEKFKASISAVTEKFQDYKITCIVLPNLGNITKISLSQYQGVFDNINIDEVIIPKWSTKIAEDSETYASESYFKSYLEDILSFGPKDPSEKVARSDGKGNIKVIKDDDKLVEYLISKINSSDENQVILFMGSEPFRGMIDILINRIKNVQK